MSKKNIALIAVLVVIIGAGVWWKFGTNNKVSEGATKVIEAMMTCPNPNLLDMQAASNVGLGTNATAEAKAKTKAAAEKINENWQMAVGEFFAEKGLNTFLNSGVATKYLSDAEFSGKKTTVASVKLLEKEGTWETVEAEILIDGKPQKIKLVFQHDEKGLITIVTIA